MSDTAVQETEAPEAVEATEGQDENKKDRKPVLNRIEAIIAEKALETGEKVSTKLAETCLGDIARQVYADRVDEAKVQRWLEYNNDYLKARLSALESA